MLRLQQNRSMRKTASTRGAWARRSSAIALSVPAMLLLAGRASTAYASPAPTATPTQETEAIAKPSTVFIQVQWKGWVTSGALSAAMAIDAGTADAGTVPPITVTTTCSGYIASTTGDIVTAGHCVDDQTVQYGGKGDIIEQAVSQLNQDGFLQANNVDPQALMNDAMHNSTVEGTEKGSPPDRTVTVLPTKAASTVAVNSPMQATVVDFRPFANGDVALLKVHAQGPLPALQVAPDSPQDGTSVVAAGFPGSVGDSVDPNSAQPSLKDGTVSGQQTVNGVPFTEVSAATSSGMSGGPVVDSQGRVVGTVDWTPGEESQPFNFITATSSLRDMLASHGVSTSLSSADQAYRAGLADYFSGKYHEAASKFDQVLAIEPDHAQAQEYKRLAITNFPNEKQSGSDTAMVVGIGGGILALLAGSAVLLILRRKRTHTPASPDGDASADGQPKTQAPTPAASHEATASAGRANGSPSSTAPLMREVEISIDGAGEHESAGYCPNCGHRHARSALFCTTCGEQLPQAVVTDGAEPS